VTDVMRPAPMAAGPSENQRFKPPGASSAKARMTTTTGREIAKDRNFAWAEGWEEGWAVADWGFTDA